MTSKQGWDQATYSCGRCGAKRVSTTEAEYIRTYSAHQDAHAVWDRLSPVERDGFIAVLREIFSAPDLSQELMVLAHAESQRGRTT